MSTVGGTGGRLAFTFALARLLGPTNFGITAQASIYTTFTMLLLSQGFGAALIQKRELDRRDVGSVEMLNLVMAAVLTVVTLVAAPWIARFFDTPELTAVLRVLAVGLVIKGLSIVPTVLARRSLQYKELAQLQVAGVVVGGIAGVVAALLGAEYWALVVQTLLGDAVLLVGLLLLQGLPVLGGSLSRLRSMWSFSASLMGAQVVGFVGQNGDNLLIGRFLGAEALAFYALSFRLLRYPIQMIGSVVNDVSFPVFSRLLDDRDRMRSWFMLANRSVALAGWPLLVLLAAGAERGVPLLFGDRWAPAATALQWLALGGIPNITRMLLAPTVTALGRTRLVLGWNVVNVTISVVAYAVAVGFGIEGVAVAYAATSYLLTLPNVAHVGRYIDLGLRSYLRNLVPPAVASLLLAATFLGAQVGLEALDAPVPVVLAVSAVAGLVAYAAVLALAWPQVVRETRAILRLMRRRGAAPAGTDVTDAT